MKRTYEITGRIVLEYDDSSNEFKEALASYLEVIEPAGSVESMLAHVAFHVVRFGSDRMVEGVGYIGYNGLKPKDEPYSGIMVGPDCYEFEFEPLFRPGSDQ